MAFLNKAKTVSFLLPIAAVTLLSGCIIHVGGNSDDWESDGSSHSSIFGTVSISDGRSVDDVSSVNGGVELGDNVVASDIESVNGDINIGNYVTVDAIDVVNGNISIGHHFKSLRDIESVNGDITIHENSLVNGDIENVNGDIVLVNTIIERDIETQNGDITLKNNTHVKGDIVYDDEHSHGWGNSSKPTLTIESGSLVDGDIILRKEVTLNIDDEALRAKVKRHFDNH